MKIYLIRHGETTGDVEDRYGGDYDDSLSPKGEGQVKELGELIKNKGIEAIYCSPRIRAKQTAEAVSATTNAPIIIADGIRERNAYGILTGMIKTEAREKYSDEVSKLEADKLHHTVKDSEDYLSFKKRVLEQFEQIASEDKYNSIALIAHGGPISCLVREKLKLGEMSKLGDCAILELDVTDEKIALVSLHNASPER